MMAAAAVVLAVSSHPCPTPTNWTRQVSVTGGHYLHLRVFGCAGAPSVLFLHGGWGPHPSDESYDAGGLIDSERYQIVMFHQRGWGRSTPSGGTVNNTLADNIADCEVVRREAGVDRWAVVYGGSNGAMLGLAYAATHPQRMGGIVLRGLWLIRTQDLLYDYCTLSGKAAYFPQDWDSFADRVGCGRSDGFTCQDLDLVRRYGAALDGPDAEAHGAAAAWLAYDALGASVHPSLPGGDWSFPTAPLATARLGVSLYLEHAADTSEVGGANLLTTAARRLGNGRMPFRLVTGTFDMLCPPAMAYEVAAALGDGGSLRVVSGASHSARDPGMASVIRESIESVARLAGVVDSQGRPKEDL